MKSLLHELPARPVVLSPMAGYSDSPYRHLCMQQGSAMSVTEFVSALSIVRGSVKSIDLFRYKEAERPVIFQVFGNDPDIIIEACKKVAFLRPDGFDLNMGCSVRKVAHKGSGVGLMREPQKVKKIISGMVSALKVPVSAKLRLGWSGEELNYGEIARIVEGEGAWAITMHGRTRQMAYSGEADWNHIGELKQKMSIPVFGNGDVASHEEAVKKMKQYGVDGVFIGRAAIGNPWIFGRQNGCDLGLAERLPVILTHLDSMVDFYGIERGVVLFRKHLLKYLKGIEQVMAQKNYWLQLNCPVQLKEFLLAHQRQARIVA